MMRGEMELRVEQISRVHNDSFNFLVLGRSMPITNYSITWSLWHINQSLRRSAT
jgi:hypothetical protein